MIGNRLPAGAGCVDSLFGPGVAEMGVSCCKMQTFARAPLQQNLEAATQGPTVSVQVSDSAVFNVDNSLVSLRKAAESPLVTFQRSYLADCVYKLTIVVDQGKYLGTCFHYGNGWFITNSHCLSDSSNLAKQNLWEVIDDAILSHPSINVKANSFWKLREVCKVALKRRINESLGDNEAPNYDDEGPDLAMFYIPFLSASPSINCANNTRGFRAVIGVNDIWESGKGICLLDEIIQTGLQTACIHYSYYSNAHNTLEWEMDRRTVQFSEDEVITSIDLHDLNKVSRGGASIAHGGSGAPVFTRDYGKFVGLHCTGNITAGSAECVHATFVVKCTKEVIAIYVDGRPIGPLGGAYTVVWNAVV